MADIQFEEDQQMYVRHEEAVQGPFLIRLVLATRIVQTEQQAQYVLLGIAVLLIAFAFFIPSLINGTQGRVPQSAIDKAIVLPPEPLRL